MAFVTFDGRHFISSYKTCSKLSLHANMPQITFLNYLYIAWLTIWPLLTTWLFVSIYMHRVKGDEELNCYNYFLHVVVIICSNHGEGCVGWCWWIIDSVLWGKYVKKSRTTVGMSDMMPLTWRLKYYWDKVEESITRGHTFYSITRLESCNN